jgi:hypothetical protein
MRHWYALMLCEDEMARLVKDREAITILAEYPFVTELDRRYRLSLEVRRNRITGEIDGSMVADVVDDSDPLPAGAFGLIVTEGTLSSGAVRVEPVL